MNLNLFRLKDEILRSMGFMVTDTAERIVFRFFYFNFAQKKPSSLK